MHLTPARRHTPRLARVVALCLTATLLSACVPDADGRPTPTPTPTRTALYASDEEALAAAEKVYREYLEVVEGALNGVGDLGGIEQLATGDMLEAALNGVAEYESRGLRSTGQREVVSIELLWHDQGRQPPLAILVCEDVTDVDVVDSDGGSVVSPDRPPRTLLAVGLELGTNGPLVSTREARSNEC